MKDANTLIGKYFPFFTNNTAIGSSFYLYQVTSPGLDDKLKPTLTLTKVGEKTGKDDFQANEETLSMNSGDIIRLLMKKNRKSLSDYVKKDLISTSTKKILGDGEPINVKENGSDFPIFSMDSGDLISRSIIINLRDSLRWNVYKFFDGKYVDILQNDNKFTIFKIHDDGESLWLEPVNTYSVLDVSLERPIKNFHPYYPTDKFSGKLRNSDLNRAIRAQEWRILQ